MIHHPPEVGYQPDCLGSSGSPNVPRWVRHLLERLAGLEKTPQNGIVCHLVLEKRTKAGKSGLGFTSRRCRDDPHVSHGTPSPLFSVVPRRAWYRVGSERRAKALVGAVSRVCLRSSHLGGNPQTIHFGIESLGQSLCGLAVAGAERPPDLPLPIEVRTPLPWHRPRKDHFSPRRGRCLRGPSGRDVAPSVPQVAFSGKWMYHSIISAPIAQVDRAQDS